MQKPERMVNGSEIANYCLAGPGGQDFMLIEMQHDVALPGLKICRIKAPLNYVNAESFMNEVLSIVDSAPSILRWFILRFDFIDDVDDIGANKLMELADRLGREQVSLIFAEIPTSLGASFLIPAFSM